MNKKLIIRINENLEYQNTALKDQVRDLRRVNKEKQKHIKGLETRNAQLSSILKADIRELKQRQFDESVVQEVMHD